MMNQLERTLKRIFSDRYVNPNAVADNYLLLLMYRVAYPFAVALNKMGCSPNLITTLSLASSVLAFLALCLDDGWQYFFCFWGIAILLDFCDGTVARMANKVSRMALRYDHISDLVKIFLVTFGAAIRYDDLTIWILAMLSSFLFMYFTVLNHELDSAQRRNLQRVTPGDVNDAALPATHRRLSERYRMIGWLIQYDWVIDVFKNLYSALITINGHTLLLLLLLAAGAKYSLFVFIYLICISLLAIRSRVMQLIRMER